jgi:hypothetical protein
MMANNRLYIRHIPTGDLLYIAKGLRLETDREHFDEFMREHPDLGEGPLPYCLVDEREDETTYPPASCRAELGPANTTIMLEEARAEIARLRGELVSRRSPTSVDAELAAARSEHRDLVNARAKIDDLESENKDLKQRILDSASL